jgi:hypothetical protein
MINRRKFLGFTAGSGGKVTGAILEQGPQRIPLERK